MRIALLSNVTTDLLADMLKKNTEVYLSAGFDTWQQEILNPASGLYSFNPEAVVVLLHADAYEDLWTDKDKAEQEIDTWCGTFQFMASQRPGVPLFISSLDISDTPCRYGAEPYRDLYPEDLLERKVELLHREGMSVYILPVKEGISRIGRNAFYSPKMWYVGSMPYSIKGLTLLSDLIIRYSGAIKGAKKKCLALDLDNTLWGGVIGEDGVNGIQLSSHKEGARFRDTQQILKKMKEQGVMLAILSKNNPEDVEPVYMHPDMVLQHEDFVAEVINWEPKHANIRQLAKDLNIGLDAFVFLDDNPAEREQMKAECPEVTVIDFPKDTAQLPATVAKAYDDWFFSLEVTGEDARKTAMYRAETQRKAEMNASASVEDYLKKLEMTITINRMSDDEEKRVVQLVNKTNQFNVTTRRYAEEEIHQLSKDKQADIITIHLADKYGDQGLTAVLILKYKDDEAEIDTFLMSCRIMGRSAETEIIAQIKQMLADKGIHTLHATYLKTAKNTPVKELFEKLGFDVISADESGKQYRIAVTSLPVSTGMFQEVINKL